MADEAELTERDWERCDQLWAAVAGEVSTETCMVSALVAMHESDRENIELVCDPSGTGVCQKGDLAVYLLEKKATRGVVKFDSFLRCLLPPHSRQTLIFARSSAGTSKRSLPKAAAACPPPRPVSRPLLAPRVPPEPRPSMPRKEAHPGWLSLSGVVSP